MLTFEGFWGDKVRLKSDENVISSERIYTKEFSNGILFVKSTNIPGIYCYGFEQTKDSDDAEAGYIWSSRAGYVNKQFGLTLHECAIGSDARFAVDLKFLEPMLSGTKYKIDYTPVVYFNTDIVYKIIEDKE